jgi:putative transposase
MDRQDAGPTGTWMKTPSLGIYWRKLPHWRMSGAVYFVTWRLAKHQPALGPDERTFVVTAIRHFENQRYDLPAYVVMDDHVHVLVRPVEGSSLHRIVHSWKSYTATRLGQDWGRLAPVWQREYFDRIVRDVVEWRQKAEYIVANPLKKWPSEPEYPWVGFGSCL